jgi:hypothetical protein
MAINLSASPGHSPVLATVGSGLVHALTCQLSASRTRCTAGRKSIMSSIATVKMTPVE